MVTNGGRELLNEKLLEPEHQLEKREDNKEHNSAREESQHEVGLRAGIAIGTSQFVV